MTQTEHDAHVDCVLAERAMDLFSDVLKRLHSGHLPYEFEHLRGDNPRSCLRYCALLIARETDHRTHAEIGDEITRFSADIRKIENRNDLISIIEECADAMDELDDATHEWDDAENESHNVRLMRLSQRLNPHGVRSGPDSLNTFEALIQTSNIGAIALMRDRLNAIISDDQRESLRGREDECHWIAWPDALVSQVNKPNAENTK